MPPAAHHYSGRFVAENLLTKKIVRKSVQKRVGVDLDPRTAAKQAAHKRKSCIMNNPENLTYSIDKTRLRMGAAVGVLVIAAGFALGSVMHTSSSSANEPTSSVIDNNTSSEEAPVIVPFFGALKLVCDVRSPVLVLSYDSDVISLFFGCSFFWFGHF